MSFEKLTSQASVNSSNDLLGSTIAGKYRLDAKLGAGGMGAVYRAKRLMIGDEVAVKILHTEQSDPNAAARFRREAQAAARLKHPNAVTIHDFGITDDGLQYLVMEFVEGESLRRIIKEQGPVTPSASVEILNQVCAALGEAHRQHIVHRDIKPDNIIVHSAIAGMRVKVLDFGIAKLRDDVASHLTQAGSVMGTPHYMSPEQCLGEELDSRADIYSMGIVLYEMLCGRVPFDSPISTAVVVQHVNQAPPALRSINISISPQVEAVVLHALQKSRDARPASAGTLARAFSAAVQQTNAETPSHAAWPQVSSPLQPPARGSEETAMQRAAQTPTAIEMPATVHLPQGSGPNPSVRSTVPSGTLVVTRTNRKWRLTIGAAVVGVVLLAAVGAVIIRKPSRERIATSPNQSDRVPTPPPGISYVPGGEFAMGNKTGVAQGPNEIQTHGEICADPARPCSAGGVFSDSDLSFALPAKVEWQRNYYSANFYAIVLKSKAVVSDETPDTDNCKQGFFPAGERSAAQSLFPARKVFASEFGCYLVKIGYTNINYKYNFLAVYAGESPAQAQIALREVKATGKFPGANIRKMQVVFQNGD